MKSTPVLLGLTAQIQGEYLAEIKSLARETYLRRKIGTEPEFQRFRRQAFVSDESTQVVAWHSRKRNTANVYHNNRECLPGRTIAPESLAEGTNGRPLCGICQRLNRQKSWRNVSGDLAESEPKKPRSNALIEKRHNVVSSGYWRDNFVRHQQRHAAHQQRPLV